MDGVREQDWISTGKAARLMGYSPDWFARKFDGIIPCQRSPNGHRRWLRSAVESIRNSNSVVSQAS